jgi:hypothetical protein
MVDSHLVCFVEGRRENEHAVTFLKIEIHKNTQIYKILPSTPSEVFRIKHIPRALIGQEDRDSAI